MSLIFRLFLGIVVSLSTACSKNSDTPEDVGDKSSTASDRFHVEETFNVGEGTVVRALAVDSKNKRLWVGSSVGVVEADSRNGNVMATFTRDNALANEYVFSILVDSHNNKWFGTNGGGVSRLDTGGKWKTYFPMHGLADYWVYSFAEQANGNVWIGTWNGISVLNPKNGQIKNYVKELINEWVYGLAVDKQDRVWIGTEGGINRFDGKSWVSWTHKDGLGAPNNDKLPFSANTGLGTRSRHDLSVLVDGKETYNPNYVFCLRIDDKGRVWAGTWGGGVSRFDGKKWQNFTTRDGLAGNIVYSMTLDPNGGLWFGTNHGLSYYDGAQWQAFTAQDGLLDDQVYAVAADNNGNIWAGTRNGVSRIAR